jgi:hypothetical protein
MNRNTCLSAAYLIVAIVTVFGVWELRTQAEDNKAPYPTMASIDQYMMDPNAEIALARTAAPDSITRDATVLVLGKHGYETAVKGSNGFVCAVERGWAGPIDSEGVWNPKNRSPICYNPPAVRSALPLTLKRTELAMAGKSREEIKEWEKAAYAKKQLPATVEPGAMSYMLSKEAYLTDSGDHNLAHLMFYTPVTDGATWGADVPNSPVIFFMTGPPGPFTVFLVPTGRWSDGTPAPLP